MSLVPLVRVKVAAASLNSRRPPAVRAPLIWFTPEPPTVLRVTLPVVVTLAATSPPPLKPSWMPVPAKLRSKMSPDADAPPIVLVPKARRMPCESTAFCPVPVMRMAPLPVDSTFELFLICTPKLLTPPPAPPVPVRVITPVEAVAALVLSKTMPLLLLMLPAKPCPVSVRVPVPEESVAPLREMPSLFAAVPTAAPVDGVAPPPSVMAPSLLLMTVPEPREIAPEPPPSRSALSVTA